MPDSPSATPRLRAGGRTEKRRGEGPRAQPSLRPGPRRQPTSLADEAYQKLEARLVFLDIPPGAALNESRLAAELNVGRTPLREAIKRLESEHLVVTYPRRGTFATSVDITALSEISQVREVLEPLAARLAAERLGGAGRDGLEALLADMEAHRGRREDHGLEWDARVHRELYAAAGNSHLQATLVRYGNLALRIWCLVADRIPDLQEHVDAHRAVLRAVLDGDQEQAGEAMLRHVQDFEARLRQVL